MAAQRQDQHRTEPILSVVMCTYNGEPYLQEQLDSIARQTRLPDELIVCDDGSTDATLQILSDFQEKVSFPTKIYGNEKRLGSTRNFEKAITLCNVDIIAFSDQDDVWMPHKLERLEKMLQHHPEAGYVFSDALVVNEMLRPLGYTMWKRVSFTPRQRRRFEKGHQLEVLLKRNVVTGATMAFRQELRDWILPIPEQWVHDAWIALIAGVIGKKGVFVEEPLIYYRQHPKQAIGGKKFSFAEQLRRLYDAKAELYNFQPSNYALARDRLASVGKITRETEQLFKAKITHLQTRQWLYAHSHWRRFSRVFKELILGRYHQFSNGWKSVAKDLFMVIK